MKVKLAPSILTADFTRLGEQVREAEAAGIDWWHIDIMDGHFVPNISVGPLVVRSLRGITSLTIDCHLMIERPDDYIPAFVDAGADRITVHVEACRHIHRTLQLIRSLGARPGVALNPGTPLIAVEEVLADLDLLLVMSVNPGYGGQSYLPATTGKIARAREMIHSRGLSGIEIQVDGGIKAHNIAEVAGAGATVLVVGSSVFNQEADIATNVRALRRGLLARSHEA